MNQDNLANTLTNNYGYVSIVTYLSFCVLFFTVKFVYFPENGGTWILLFLVASFIIQLGCNIDMATNKNVCGKMDGGFAFYHTIIPWLFIFTIASLCLWAFPGWLRVFSNTFGSYAAYAYGLQGVLDEIFTQDSRNSAVNTAATDIQLLKTIDSVYSNPNTIINELDSTTMTTMTEKSGEANTQKKIMVWESLNRLIDTSIIKTPSQELVQKLYNMSLLKDNVGYFVWYLLLGSLASMVSVNSILSSRCGSTKKSSYDIIFNTNT